jgi:hypothetical protein
VLQPVPPLVMAVGDRLGVLPGQVGGEPGEVGAGVLPLLATGQAGGEGLSERGQPRGAAREHLRADLTFGEQFPLPDLITPVHRPPPRGVHLRRKAFLYHGLDTLNRILTAEILSYVE